MYTTCRYAWRATEDAVFVTPELVLRFKDGQATRSDMRLLCSYLKPLFTSAPRNILSREIPTKLIILDPQNNSHCVASCNLASILPYQSTVVHSRHMLISYSVRPGIWITDAASIDLTKSNPPTIPHLLPWILLNTSSSLPRVSVPIPPIPRLRSSSE